MSPISTGAATNGIVSGRALVLDFREIDAGALSLVGGKALNLGVLTRAGLPVPPGVCVTTDAYAVVADSAGLERVLDALAHTPATDTVRMRELAGAARSAMLDAPVPDDIAKAIVAGYEELGSDVPVAVRSSATAEDLPFASFAGQQETYLNVVGSAAVLSAVRHCWASLWTDRAVAYRATNGIDHRTVRLAVVVQRMIDAIVAGVLFTANPVTGRRGQAVIDASPGLGEAVVSGAVNPDRFVVDAVTAEILERRIGDKRVEIRSRRGGGTEHVERNARIREACLTDDEIRALAALGARVEVHYGAPQDTEWAIDAAGAIWLTQARPITTLFPLPANATKEELRVYLCFSVAQGLYRPLTPMGLAAFRLLASCVSEMFGFPVAEPLAGPRRYVEAGQRMFVDLTPILRNRTGREIMPRFLHFMEARSAAVLRPLLGDPRLSIVESSGWRVARRILRIMAHHRVPVTALVALVNPAAALRRTDRIGMEIARRVALPDSASAGDRLDHVEHVLLHHCMPLGPALIPVPAVGFGMLAVARALLGSDAQGDELQSVLRGLPHNVTTDMDLELWALASRIRRDSPAAAAFREASTDELAVRFQQGTLPAGAQSGVAEFLSRYGHRAVAEIDLGMPRWSDDPRHVLGVITNYLRADDPAHAPDAIFARGAAEAEAMVETLALRARRRGRVRARIVRFALRRARVLIGLRELPKNDIVTVIAAMRRQVAIVGRELAQQGRLETADDVFFVDLSEARAGLAGCDLRGIVKERRVAYELELRRRHLPRVLLSDGTEPEAIGTGAPVSDGALSGTPASAGTVTGTARVVMDPVGAHLEPGEILVAPSTDPGWTPLFLTAGGLVMEMGGSNSHGAVVAREYGIPAVVGVQNATTRIASGQRITVDGSAGTVTVL